MKKNIRFIYALFIITLIGSSLVFVLQKKINDEKKLITNTDKTEVQFIYDTIVIPKGYNIIGEANGDLDQDGVDEKVIVYNTDRRVIEDDLDFGTEREVRIYKKGDNRWKMLYKSVKAVRSSESGGMMGDPFSDIKIENGNIVISNSGGSREKWNITNSYKLQNGFWKLIKTDSSSIDPCNYSEDTFTDFLTGKVIYTKEIQVCDANDEVIDSKSVLQKKEYTQKIELLSDM